MKTFMPMLLAFGLMLSTGFAGDKETRLFELRTYHTAPGKLEELHTRFRDHTMKLFEKHGITNIGYWTPVDNTNHLLIYILAYPDRQAREQDWKEFMGDPEWQKVWKASEVNGKLVEKVDSVFLKPTDFSPMVSVSQSGEPRSFELRKYHASPGKLDDLLSRFRDHTGALFDKHGLKQFGYWTPTEKKDGEGETLVYILVHNNKESADANWKAFREDADWVKVKADSEAGGPLTVKGGVQSTYMTPTDYSPTK
jgi:hypothetical protein